MAGPVVFLNGLFVALDRARVSVLDRGFCYGDGLFETMRAYRGKVFQIHRHLDRLYRSADLISLDLPMTRGEVRDAIQETVARNRWPEAIVRLTLTRGEQPPGLRIDPDAPPTLAILGRPFEPPPPGWYIEGVKISLYPSSAHRISSLNTQVKSCNYLSHILLREKASRENSLEAIMLDEHNQLAEGTTSNIFLVKQRVLKTPPLNEYVLPGITRQVVLDLAETLGIRSSQEQLTREDLYAADEVFLTNTGVELLPVTRADQQVIGTGQPGTLTGLLHRAFLKAVDGEI